MILSLDDVKIYLKVDNSDEDKLITDIVNSAEEMCEGILRFPLSDYEIVPESIRQVILYITANFYENREKINIKEVLEVAKNLLSPFRNEEW
jgi:uncharacterized phage protein (predicted DNA packaging)